MAHKFGPPIRPVQTKQPIDYSGLVARAKPARFTGRSYDQLAERLDAAEWALALLIEIRVQDQEKRTDAGLLEYAVRVRTEA